ncbi:MAG: PAS domain S-box protein [Actinobacteria bacterium]|nr:MAG: PAS domain S-box protein [Actinomycetota bacterium]
MTLRRKTILVIVPIFIALLVILNLISWIFIQGSYDKLERDAVSENISRALITFSDNISSIATTCKDWAYWDDTYDFMADRNQAYIDSNLDIWVFENLQLNVMVYVDPSGDIAYGKGFDLLADEEAPLPPDLIDHIYQGAILLDPAASEEGVMGVLLLEENPLLIVSEPILNSQAEGPSRGALIMGRYLDAREIEKLAEIGHQDIEITGFETEPVSGGLLDAKESFLAGENMDIQVLTPDSIAGYTPIDDIFGDPVLIMGVVSARAIHRQGVTTLIYFHIFLFIACIIIGLSVILLMERLVLSRISRLSREVIEIGISGDQAARVSLSGRDELARLAGSINIMLDRLERSEERFKSMTEHALDIITVLDADGRTTYESPSVEKMLGYERGYFREHNPFDLVHPDDVSHITDTLARILQAPGAVERVELRFRHKDGTWRNLVAIGYNLIEDPSVGGIVVNARDITRQVMARERLEKVNLLFRSLGADPRENIYKIVLAGRDILGVAAAAYCRRDKARCFIITTEPGMETPREVKDPDGSIAFDIIIKDLREPVLIEDIIAEGFIDTSPLVRRHGFKSFTGYPVVCKQKTVGCISLYDVEARAFSGDEVEVLGTLAHALQVEEERISNERDIKDFMDVASHELRHPITLVKGYALTLRDYGGRLDEASRLEFLNMINAGADRLDALTGELLDISRIERGRFALNRRMVEIEPIIRNAVGEMGEKGLEVRFDVSVQGDLPPRFIDPEKIIRVLVILLDNACEHSPAASLVRVTAKRDGSDVLISVIDQGVGVPEKERELIFERFYQVGDPVNRPTSGMGLGLYIAREIVEAHGGRIWHEDREGGGSIFRFSLPRVERV